MAKVARQSSKGRSRKRGRGQKAEPRKAAFDPAKHFMPTPVPKRDYGPDPVTGEPVTDILTAIADPATGRPSNFDSVLKRLEAQETLAENERIVYMGNGSFGILVEQKGKSPRYSVRKRIQVEDDRETPGWRRELSPGISRDYVPSPEPLSVLYGEAEANVVDNKYGRLHASIYLPRND